MSVSFNICGKLSKGKETEKFKPHDIVTTESYERLKESFSIAFDTNKVFATVQGFKTENNRDVKLLMRSEYKDGKEIKRDPETRSASEWRKPGALKNVADFAKFIFDPLTKDERKAWGEIETAIADKQSPTSEQLAKFGFETVEEFNEKKDDPKYARYESAFGYDFGDYLDKVLDNEDLTAKKYHVTGSYSMSYYNGKFYNSYDVKKIVAAEKDEKESGTISLKFLFNENSMDDSAIEETGRIAVSGWTMSYGKLPNEERGGDKPYPFFFNILKPTTDDAKAQKRYDLYKKWFTVDTNASDYEEDAIYEMGIVCDIVNGTSFVPFTIDQASEEDREMFEMDMITMEDLYRKYDRYIAGSSTKEFIVKKPSRNYSSGSQITSYRTDDMNVFGNENAGSDDADDMEDLFED